jgi:hypothetical protein
MKQVYLTFCILAVALAQTISVQDGWRLIEFSETDRKWLSTQYVSNGQHLNSFTKVENTLVSECGKGKHGGFIDITEHQTLNATGAPLKVQNYLKASPFPSKPTHQAEVESFIASLSKDTMKTYNDKLSSYFTRYLFKLNIF